MSIIEVKPLEQKPLFAGVEGGLDVVIVNPGNQTLYVRVHAQSIVISRRKGANYGRSRERPIALLRVSQRGRMIGFGNDELAAQPSVKAGDLITCPHCAEKHPLECATAENGEPTDLLMFYTCAGKAYLGGVAGRLADGGEKP